jgi:trigger factor
VTIHKEISRQEHSSVKLTLTVGKEEIRSQHDEILANYGKNLQLPGFRRGKVPREVLLRKLGEGLKAETIGTLIEKSVAEVFADESFPRESLPLPYSSPQLQGEPTLDMDQDFSFTLVYDVFPELSPGPWKGLEIEVPEVEISDEDLNRELEALRERNAVVIDREDGAPAEKGNVVTVDYCELGEDGAPLPHTERQDFVFTLGLGYNVYKLDDDVAGMKKGETREIAKTYPEDEEDSSLAGKTIRLRVSLSALKERKLPDLDDDLAQDVDEKFNTLEDLKNNIRETLNRNLERRLRSMKIDGLLEKIMAASPVEIPESMIRIEQESRWRSMARVYNTTVDQLQKTICSGGRSLEDVQESWRPGLIKALHSRLIVETLIKQLNLEAGDGDLEKEIEELSAGDKERAEEFKKYYEQEQVKEQLREEIKERKFFDILLAENTVKPGKRGNYLDLMSDNG